jgi:hypothetical protein
MNDMDSMYPAKGDAHRNRGEKFPPTDSGRCNTYLGYPDHVRRDQWACEGCLKAHTDYTKASHIISGKQKGLQIPLSIIREWLNSPGTVLSDWLPDIIVFAIQHGCMPTQLKHKLTMSSVFDEELDESYGLGGQIE